jgi:hypothetical protein
LLCPIVVNTAVEFDREQSLRAREVENERTNGMLTPKAKTRQVLAP